ncbi:MAG: hypothetical protein AAF810_17090, partial [Cyanobacteria bacterium P01_D01_bin.36]
ENTIKTSEPPLKESNGIFSRWSRQVKTFFQSSKSLKQADKSSEQITLEELPVIVEEKTADDPVDDNTKDSLVEEPLGIERRLKTEDEIGERESDEGISTKKEPTIEPDPFENFIVPDTLNAPSSPSENVVAPLAE